MLKRVSISSAELHRDQRGQMAWLMLLTLLVVFAFFALALDSGLWYLDHRNAQNQSEAAALAGALTLPATTTTAARDAALDWLQRNQAARTSNCNSTNSPGATTFDSGVAFWQTAGNYTKIRVCVSRNSPGVFSALSGINAVRISGAATATAGPVDIATVMPWYVGAPDPGCDGTPDHTTCKVNYNYDPDIDDPGEHTCSFAQCPYGLDLNALYEFKGGGGGNSGAIDACGNGASNYRDCITGSIVSGFYQSGTSIVVGVKPGNLGVNTQNALDSRYAGTGATNGGACNVNASPSVTAPPAGPEQQYVFAPDAAGKARATARFVTAPPNPDCPLRLVTIPIFSGPLPANGNTTVTVLGIATFGIAAWADPGNKTFSAAPNGNCLNTGNKVPAGSFDCGMVWGYMFSGVTPPNVLLEQIGTSGNPFAPILIALTD